MRLSERDLNRGHLMLLLIIVRRRNTAMLDRLMKAIDRWRVIQLDTQVSGHESRCLLM